MLFFSLLVSFSCLQARAQTPVKLPELRMGSATSAPMPLADFVTDQGKTQIVQGIYVDIARELAKELGTKIEVRAVPRVRISNELEKGYLDFVCYYRPSWLKGDFLFLDDIFQTGDYIVWRAGAPPIKSLSQLEGVRLGTARGYAHPEIEVGLGKKFIRVEYESVDAVVKKMLLKDVDYIILNKLNYDYLSKTSLYAGKMAEKPLLITSFRTGCAISQKARMEPMRIRVGLENMLKKGTFKKILKSYGLEDSAVQ